MKSSSKFSKLQFLSACLFSGEKANENDSRVDLILPAADGQPEEAFVVTENFHLREFIAPLDAIVPQSREIHDFAKGAMLQVRNK